MSAARSQPAEFNQQGIRFQYPGTWELDQAEALEGNRSVTVYGPGGSFWSVAAHSVQRQPRELLDMALVAMRQVYEQLDCEPLAERLAGRECTGYEMNFYCLDLTNTAWFRAFRTSEATYLIHCQAEDRDLPQVAPVFEAMTVSLLSHLGRT